MSAVGQDIRALLGHGAIEISSSDGRPVPDQIAQLQMAPATLESSGTLARQMNVGDQSLAASTSGAFSAAVEASSVSAPEAPQTDLKFDPNNLGFT